MAGKVFSSVSMSLDGFIAPESMDWLSATPAQREQDPRLRPPESTEDHARELAFPESTCSQK